MAEYDKGRYYWIKLTDRFMTSDTVDFLMSQKDGANYVVLYQMLCLKTVNNNGVMARQLGEMIVPYDVDKIQRDCKWFSIDTVRIALELYKNLGLIYENNDGILAIADFDRMIGSQTFGAEKKELQKLRGGTKVENFPPEKEIKRLRDKEKEKDIYINTTTTTNNHSFIQSEEFALFTKVAKAFGQCRAKSNPEDFIAYNEARGWLGIGGESVLDNLERYVCRWESYEIAKRGNKECELGW
jgi:hypothetical protein